MANLNIFPVGSEQWIESQMAYYEPIIRKNITELAVLRGLDPNDPLVQRQIQEELEKIRLQLSQKGSEYQYESQEAEKNRQLQKELMEKEAKAQERAAMYSGLGNIAAFSLFNRPVHINKEGEVSLGKSGFEKLRDLFKPQNITEPTGETISKYTPAQTYGLPIASGLFGGLVSGKKLTSSSTLVPTALSTVGSNLFSNPVSPTWSSLASFLGAISAPKDGLFKRGKDKEKSWLSVGLSTAPIWGRLLGIL